PAINISNVALCSMPTYRELGTRKTAALIEFRVIGQLLVVVEILTVQVEYRAVGELDEVVTPFVFVFFDLDRPHCPKVCRDKGTLLLQSSDLLLLGFNPDAAVYPRFKNIRAPAQRQTRRIPRPIPTITGDSAANIWISERTTTAPRRLAKTKIPTRITR